MYVITLQGTKKPYYLNKAKDLFTVQKGQAANFANLAQAQDALQSILSWSPNSEISEIESEPVDSAPAQTDATQTDTDKIKPLFDNPDFISDILADKYSDGGPSEWN